MPMTDFECPDGGLIPIGECLKKCRMAEGRCVSKPTLTIMSRQRTWNGKISSTQALNGTRYEYLRVTRDYAEAPMMRAFALLGTFHHLKMQSATPAEGLAEVFVEDDQGTGIFDYYDSEEKALWDFKTAGAWKVAKATGRSKTEEVIPEGEPGHGLFTRGPRKGEPRTRNVWGLVEPDNFEWRMQLSRYAMMIEDAGFPVEVMYIQVTVRDFGARTPQQYGLHRQIYVIKLQRIPREEVERFYKEKQDALLAAIEHEKMPPACNSRETWGGRRCLSYCPVWKDCDEGWRARENPRQPDSEEAPTNE